MRKYEIKLHNRRVAVKETEEPDAVMIEFKSFDEDIDLPFHAFMGPYAIIIDAERKRRRLEIKISKEALFALRDIANDIEYNHNP